LNVPAIGGNGINHVRADAERRFKQVCGGTVCVKLLTVVPPEPVGQDCEVSFVGTSPPADGLVQRGSVVKLLFELDSCEPLVPDGGDDGYGGDETPDPESDTSIAPPTITADYPPATTND